MAIPKGCWDAWLLGTCARFSSLFPLEFILTLLLTINSFPSSFFVYPFLFAMLFRFSFSVTLSLLFCSHFCISCSLSWRASIHSSLWQAMLRINTGWVHMEHVTMLEPPSTEEKQTKLRALGEGRCVTPHTIMCQIWSYPAFANRSSIMSQFILPCVIVYIFCQKYELCIRLCSYFKCLLLYMWI